MAALSVDLPFFFPIPFRKTLYFLRPFASRARTGLMMFSVCRFSNLIGLCVNQLPGRKKLRSRKLMISSRPSRAVPPSSASACLPAMKRISKQLRVECRRLLFLALHFASKLVAPTGGPYVVVQFGQSSRIRSVMRPLSNSFWAFEEAWSTKNDRRSLNELSDKNLH